MEPGDYEVVLCGWEPEAGSQRWFGSVQVRRQGDGTIVASSKFTAPRSEVVKLRSFAVTKPGESPNERAVQALTLIIDDRVGRHITDGEEPPATAAFTPEELDGPAPT